MITHNFVKLMVVNISWRLRSVEGSLVMEMVVKNLTRGDATFRKRFWCVQDTISWCKYIGVQSTRTLCHKFPDKVSERCSNVAESLLMFVRWKISYTKCIWSTIHAAQLRSWSEWKIITTSVPSVSFLVFLFMITGKSRAKENTYKCLSV
jgi:hypothetical protein